MRSPKDIIVGLEGIVIAIVIMGLILIFLYYFSIYAMPIFILLVIASAILLIVGFILLSFYELFSKGAEALQYVPIAVIFLIVLSFAGYLLLRMILASYLFPGGIFIAVLIAVSIIFLFIKDILNFIKYL